ncbi:MAG: T9SS type A sorting domain-containing protein [Flavobacteriales bacterium]
MKLFFSSILTLAFLTISSQGITQQWEVVGLKGFNIARAEYTNIAFDPSSSTPYVAYQNDVDGTEIRKYDGSQWTMVGSEVGSFAIEQSLAFSRSSHKPYLAYQLGYSEPFNVKKFNGNQWVTVGNDSLSTAGADGLSLAFPPSSDNPYVAFVDNAIGSCQEGGATVKKFNGNQWVNVGSQGFSDSCATELSLAFSPSGTPYIAYKDIGNGGKATVKKFDGNQWTTVGTDSFSAGSIYRLNLAFNPSSGNPYLAYEDYSPSAGSSVKKFDGNQWVTVGNGALPIGGARSIAFSSANTPYVAIEEGGASMLKYTGTEWDTVGLRKFSDGGVEDISLAIPSNSNTPYVAYRDQANSKRATVMKYGQSTSVKNRAKFSRNYLKVTPNPFEGVTQVNYDFEETDPLTITILTIGGKKLRSITKNPPPNGKDHFRLNLTELSSGIYLYRAKTENFLQTGKLIVRNK